MMQEAKDTLSYLILRLALTTGRTKEDIEADINAKLDAGNWESGTPYWALNQHQPFIPSNGLIEENKQGQEDAYDGFCSMAAHIYNAALNGGEDALEWARFELLHLSWMGGTLASLKGERGRAKQTGAMTGALKATPEDVLQRTHDLYWENMRELRHDKNARIKTGIQIAELEGRSKPLSERAVFDRLKKHKERTKT